MYVRPGVSFCTFFAWHDMILHDFFLRGFFSCPARDASAGDAGDASAGDGGCWGAGTPEVLAAAVLHGCGLFCLILTGTSDSCGKTLKVGVEDHVNG